MIKMTLTVYCKLMESFDVKRDLTPLNWINKILQKFKSNILEQKFKSLKLWGTFINFIINVALQLQYPR